MTSDAPNTLAGSRRATRVRAAALAVLVVGAWTAGWSGEDPLAEAARDLSRHRELVAVGKALGVARSADEPAERRGKGFRIAAEAYKEMGAHRLAVATHHQALAQLGGDNPHAVDCWAEIAQIHYDRREYHEAIGVLQKAQAELDLAKVAEEPRSRLLSLLAKCRDKAGQVGAALAVYETLISLTQEGEHRTAALARAARLYAELHELEKAEACLRRASGAMKTNTAVTEVAQAYQAVSLSLAAAGRAAESQALDRRIVSAFARREPTTARAALKRLVVAAADDGARLDVAARLEGEEAVALASDEVLALLVPAALRTGRTDEVVRHCLRAALADLFGEAVVYTCLKAVVAVRVREDRFGDAVAAAAACYGCTGFASYVSASQFARSVDLVAEALMARDGHLVGANAFRRYQVYGPAGPDRKAGTPDDIANPLAGAAFKADAATDRLLKAAVDGQPDSAKGHRARGWIYLLWCKPKEALKAFRQAFALCSLDATEMTRAAQDIALGLKALEGTPAGMAAFAQYQRYGPNGPDGRKGTRDDLKDPLAGL